MEGFTIVNLSAINSNILSYSLYLPWTKNLSSNFTVRTFGLKKTEVSVGYLSELTEQSRSLLSEASQHCTQTLIDRAGTLLQKQLSGNRQIRLLFSDWTNTGLLLYWFASVFIIFPTGSTAAVEKLWRCALAQAIEKNTDKKHAIIDSKKELVNAKFS